MIAFLTASGLLALLIVITSRTSVRGRDDVLLRVMVAGYLLRLVIQVFSRDLALFSHGGGGDYVTYEYYAREIARLWQFTGVEFVTSERLPGLGPTALPANLFAIVITLNGGTPTPFGCTALIAFLACLTCLNLYRLGVELGGDPRRAGLMAAALLFSPAYVLYTSDMYKDGIVIFFVTAAVASGIRLSRRFSLMNMLWGCFALWALWHVRFYLLFVVSAPLVVGLTGLRAKNSARPLLASLLILATLTGLAAGTNALGELSDRATTTFEHGTSTRVRAGNAMDSGSGVTFEDGGSPTGAIMPKLAYTLFSPFPWSGGSVGFHIGKIDTLLWYFIMVRSVVAARRLWRGDRTVLLMLLSFIAPTTLMYAMSFANVGLGLRQRLVIVMVGSVLAVLSWPRRAEKPVPARRDTTAQTGRTAVVGGSYAATAVRFPADG